MYATQEAAGRVFYWKQTREQLRINRGKPLGKCKNGRRESTRRSRRNRERKLLKTKQYELPFRRDSVAKLIHHVPYRSCLSQWRVGFENDRNSLQQKRDLIKRSPHEIAEI